MSKYMMATTAIHKLGDISSDEPDICQIHSEDEENYIGNWVFGHGFIDVKFPRSTTKELSQADIERFNGAGVMLSGSYMGRLKID